MKILLTTLIFIGLSSCVLRNKSNLPKTNTPEITSFTLTCIDAFDNSKMANCKAYISDSLVGTSNTMGLLNFSLNKSKYNSKIKITTEEGLHDDVFYQAQYYNATKSFYMYPNDAYESIIWEKEDELYGFFDKDDLPIHKKDSLSGNKEHSDAEFLGGNEALITYVSNTTEYPELAIENGTTGKVYVNFLVQKDGNISHLWAQRKFEDGLSKEAIRVIRNMPKWKPGTVNKEPVRVRCIMPIVFRLN